MKRPVSKTCVCDKCCAARCRRWKRRIVKNLPMNMRQSEPRRQLIDRILKHCIVPRQHFGHPSTLLVVAQAVSEYHDKLAVALLSAEIEELEASPEGELRPICESFKKGKS